MLSKLCDRINTGGKVEHTYIYEFEVKTRQIFVGKSRLSCKMHNSLHVYLYLEYAFIGKSAPETQRLKRLSRPDISYAPQQASLYMGQIRQTTIIHVESF